MPTGVIPIAQLAAITVTRKGAQTHIVKNPTVIILTVSLDADTQGAHVQTFGLNSVGHVNCKDSD